MAKPLDPLKILNTFAGAAHAKSQKPAVPDPDQDTDMAPGETKKKNPKQVAALMAKKKANA